MGAINGSILAGARLTQSLYGEYGSIVGASRPIGLRRRLRIQLGLTLITLLGIGVWSGDAARLVIFAAPPFWLFLALVGAALIVVRRRVPPGPGVFAVPLFPAIPLTFIATSLWMAWTSVGYAIDHRSWEAAWPIAVMLLGAALVWDRRRKRSRKLD
ncbi:MAG: hypothetical protein QM811_17610 [Pirellulales bacterium]